MQFSMKMKIERNAETHGYHTLEIRKRFVRDHPNVELVNRAKLAKSSKGIVMSWECRFTNRSLFGFSLQLLDRDGSIVVERGGELTAASLPGTRLFSRASQRRARSSKDCMNSTSRALALEPAYVWYSWSRASLVSPWTFRRQATVQPVRCCDHRVNVMHNIRCLSV
jgi:hypothetical protein